MTTTDAGAFSSAGSPHDPGIRLSTFAAERYVGEELGHLVDLGDLFAPPYDVLDPASTAVLRDRHPHNVVRLTMPQGADPAARGRHALASLERWRSDGVLLRDAEPGLYVLETRQHGAASPGDISGPEGEDRSPGVTVHRGVVGLLPPPSSGAGAVLPHEDVMPGPVADRLSLLEATRLQAEPILLVHDADPTVVECVDDVVTQGAPLCRATVGGTTYRLWGVSDPGWVARVQGALTRRRAFIADGHHRYATAAKLGVPVLAVLVDAAAWPLQVGAIHRSIAGVSLSEAVGHLPESCHAGSAHAAADLTNLVRNLRGGDLVLTDGTDAVEVTGTVGDAPAGGDNTVGPNTAASTSSGPLAAALLHDEIVPALGLAEERIGYHHDVDSAVRAARTAHGVAVLLAPATAAVVREVVGRGELMPRKSTSFSPKPPSGLVMHALEP